MFIRRLSLTDFRNHAAADIDVGAMMVVLTGDNGAGKTNVLEGVSLLAPGRGLRGAAFEDIARDGATGGFAIAARLAPTTAAPPDLAIGTAIDAAAPGRRRVAINGAPASAAALGEWLSVLWLTPALDRIFTDSAGARRRFLDRLALALYPGHAMQSARYEAAMRARNRLLCEERQPDPQWLNALEQALAIHGAAIDAARRDFVAALTTVSADIADGPFARPLIGIASAAGKGWDAGALRDALASSRRRDAAAKRTLVGPHRDDLNVVHAASGQAAAQCSTGEQKALLLGLVLAHGDLVAARRGQRPILLLDEIAAHLDPVRRAALFARLAAGGGQVWMTGTESGLFDAVPGTATRLTLARGEVVDVA